MDRIFYCYSKPLKDFLILNGQNYFSKAIHEKTNKKYWMFFHNEELDKLLILWSKNKLKLEGES